MKKQLAIATVAILLMAVLIAPPVMASADVKTIDVGGKQLKVIELKENSIEDIIGGKEVSYIRHYISGYVNHDEYIGDVWDLTKA